MMIIRRPLTEREHMLYQDSARSTAAMGSCPPGRRGRRRLTERTFCAFTSHGPGRPTGSAGAVSWFCSNGGMGIRYGGRVSGRCSIADFRS